MPSPCLLLSARKIDRHGLTGHRRTVGALVAVAVTLVASALAVSSPAAAQTQPFTDTSQDAYYSEAVGALAGNGIFDGTECAQGMLCPGEPIDRKTMAVWTVRALDGEDPAQILNSRFSDVAADSFHGPFIERMAELGVTSGCGDGTGFCPDNTVTRNQMAVFLTRAFNLDPGPDPGFSDVAPDAWYYNHVAALAASGITAGCGDGTTFCPHRQTTRAQMATFLARATGLVETPTPAQPNTYKAVTAGYRFSCAIATDNTITCWGDNEYGQTDAPAGTYKTVTSSYWNSCAIATDNTITCWGRNDLGQTDAPAGTYIAVTPGGDPCGLRTDDTITCWGSNYHGESDAPAGTYKTMGHSCGLRTDDTITCWGYGEADAPPGTFKTVTAGAVEHSCAIATDNTITCWGYNGSGQTDAPAGTYKTVTAGDGYSCAIATDNTITCWGYNNYEEFWYFGENNAPAGTYKALAAGLKHACAIATDNTITCWRENPYGEADAPAGTYKTVTAGIGHSCAIATDNTITCWGRNDYGQADAPAGPT